MLKKKLQKVSFNFIGTLLFLIQIEKSRGKTSGKKVVCTVKYDFDLKNTIFSVMTISHRFLCWAQLKEFK